MEVWMKTVLLMRHAKSSWKDKNLEDIDRTLNKRGKKDAGRMGHLIKEKELLPELILCSSAVRARSTAELFVEKSGYKGEVRYLDAFYLAEPMVYAEAIRTLPEELERVMLIGHNPGMEGLLQILSGKVESLSTAAIAHLKLTIDHWSDFDYSTCGDIKHLWRPRDLKDGK
jgi:phosphohistidine phosphatase